MLRSGERNETLQNIARVRSFRNEAGVSERVMWGILRGNKLGFKFRRQHPIGPYALDFYCAEAMLCVEIDGEVHAARVDQDARRDAYLFERGIATYRAPSLDLFEDSPAAEAHRKSILHLCEERAGRAAFAD